MICLLTYLSRRTPVRKYFLAVALGLVALTPVASNAKEGASPTIGVVNFANCVAKSKVGQKEQAGFENIKKQMGKLLEDTDTQLRAISEKLNDAEYLDGLSPQGEEELKIKFRSLSEELSRYQNQYYQILNQANMQLLQSLSGTVNQAAKTVANNKEIDLVVNQEAFFYFTDQLDITEQVIEQMDKMYEKELEKVAEAAKTPAAPAGKTAE